MIASLEREWEALAHFESACDLLADAEYGVAKHELELSLSLYPTTSFYDHKRVETLGDIESCLGEDEAAGQHYQRAGSGSQENGSPFQVIAVQKQLETGFVHQP